MSATFHGLEVAKSGLAASQIAVNIANQNIANAHTEGYTRQSAVQNSVSAGLGPFQYARAESAVGQGVEVTGITQNRDAYLDIRYRNANSACQSFASALSALDSVRGVLDETDTDGLNAVVSDFYTALQNLSGNNKGIEYASLLRSAAEKVTNVLNEYASQLDQIQGEISYDLSLSVSEANSMLSKIGELNRNISVSMLNGTDCNELLDARNMILDRLSGCMNINVINEPNGAVSIKCGSATILDAAAGTQKTLSVKTVGGSVGIYDETGTELTIAEGSFKGLTRSLNGMGSYASAGSDTFAGIPYYQKALDDFAASFVSVYNGINAGKGDLFSDAGGGTVTAAGIRVSENWKQNAAFVDTGRTAIEKMISAMDKKVSVSTCFTGTFQEYTALLMSNVGMDVGYYDDMTSAKSAILESIQDDREAISGISIDEETVNTIKYQKAYQAAARVMNVLDEMLDTLINGMAV